MGFLSIILKIICVLGIIGATINIYKKKDVEKNKKTIRYGLIILIIAIGIGNIESSKSAKESSDTKAQPSVKTEIQANKQQKDAYQKWLNDLKTPIEEYEKSINTFTVTLKKLQNEDIQYFDGTSIMNELEKSLCNDINYKFRNITPPDKSLFNEEQNKNIWLVTAHFSDAANNYGSAASDIARGLKTNNKSAIKHSTEYIGKANSHVDQAVKSLKSLNSEIGINSDEIIINMK